MNDISEHHHHIVLLGDSIFDNAAYVPDGLPVIEHLRQIIAPNCQATLLAVDGGITVDVSGQTVGIPDTATQLVVSVGGNDAIQYIPMFCNPVKNVGEALLRLSDIRNEFQQNYRRMLRHVMGFNLPVAICTIYNAVPGLGGIEKTALALFNEIILQEAFAARLPIIDLRLICDEEVDFSTISLIEPSHTGGHKIAQAICFLLKKHALTSDHSMVIS